MGNILGLGRIRSTSVDAVGNDAGARRAARAEHKRVAELRELTAGAVGLAEKLGELKASLDVARRVRTGGTGPATSVSAAPLDLTAAGPVRWSITSTEEVNTTPTSFDQREPGWDDPLSEAVVSVAGTYTGSTDERLEFRARDTRLSDGVGVLRLDVHDGGGTLIDTLTWAPGESSTATRTSNTGLSIALDGEVVVAGSSFFVDAWVSRDGEVDPDDPFDGTGDEDPELEPGVAVVEGSFRVNGEEVDVKRDHSLNDVLEKITDSSANVTASYDEVTERVLLQANVAGELVSLADDTSGFLDAVKLSGAVAVPDIDGGPDRPMRDTLALEAVQAGTFSINGSAFSLDPTVESLNGVLERINDREIGVTASFQGDRVRLVSAEGDLVLDSGTTDLFAHLGLDSAEASRRSGVSAGRMRQIVERVDEVGAAFDAFFAEEEAGTREVREVLKAVMEPYLAELAPYGLSFDFEATGTDHVLSLDKSEETLLERGVRAGKLDLYTALVGGNRDADVGLLEELVGAVESMARQWDVDSGGTGLLLDLYI